jgi:hypothetical protein
MVKVASGTWDTHMQMKRIEGQADISVECTLSHKKPRNSRIIPYKLAKALRGLFTISILSDI